jgi:dihydroxyacetone kinase
LRAIGAVGDEIEVKASEALLQTPRRVDNTVFHSKISRAKAQRRRRKDAKKALRNAAALCALCAFA